MGKLGPFLILAAGGIGVYFLFRFLFPKAPPLCPDGQTVLPSGGCGQWNGGHGVVYDPNAPDRTCDPANTGGWQCGDRNAVIPPPPKDWPAGTWYKQPTLTTGDLAWWGNPPPLGPGVPSHPPDEPTPPASAPPPPLPGLGCPGAAHPKEACTSPSGAKRPWGTVCRGALCLFTNISE